MLLARPRSFEFDALELDAEVFGDALAAGEDGDVFHHGLAAVAEARGLHGADVERAAQLVHDQGRERFAFDFFGDDQAAACWSCATFSSIGSKSFRLLIFFS